MLPLVLVIAFGLVFGSFLNVVISRLPDPDRTMFRPARSACPKCGHQIQARDNVPVLSWLLLRGKCRSCRTPISWVYPGVELATAGIFAYAFLTGGLGLPALTAAAFLTLLLAVAVTDAQTYLIPDHYTVGGAVLGIGLAAATGGLRDAAAAGADCLVVGFLLYGFGLFMGRVLKREALGSGDSFLVAMMAAYLGLGSTLVAIYFAAVSGVLFYVVHRRLNSERLIPFGLHLAIGGAAALLLGPTRYAVLLNNLFPWPHLAR